MKSICVAIDAAFLVSSAAAPRRHPPDGEGPQSFSASRCPPIDRQAPRSKRQVCDFCGGRFGMVTHRWWGSKFCKRKCKQAYLRDVALGRDTIFRWLCSAAPSRETRPAGA
jgi:hypothetical protein